MSAADISTATSRSIERIEAHSLRGFAHLASNGIRKSILNEFERFLIAQGTLCRPSLIIRCGIADGQYVIRIVVDKPISHSRLTRSLTPFLARVLPRICGHADFFLLVSDNVYVSQLQKPTFVDFLKYVPFLRCDQRDDDAISSHAILIPDFSIQDGRYADELAAIKRIQRSVPFDQRAEIIKWRGTLSGPDYPNLKNCEQLVRYILLMMSLKRPDILDARLTTYDNLSHSESAMALKRRLQHVFGDPSVELAAEAFVRYKYLISLDGAVAAWKRVPTILASGSVLLLHHQWNQFFYPGLEPWVHYVPLNNDICDLEARYEWLVTHRVQARVIADNGRLLARRVLRPRALEAFFVNIVNRCGELFV